MLRQFQTFYLTKLISEMYSNYYLPYCTLNEAKKREVAVKGGKIPHNEEDHEFISDLKAQIPSASLTKTLMVYYQLLGNGIHQVRPKPAEPENPKTNAPFAWIDHKTDPDEDGWITAKITMSGPGGKKKYTAHVKANIESLKNRLIQAGYDLNNQQTLESFLHTPWKTWEKRLEKSEGKHGFKIKDFGADYHASQAAVTSPQFNTRFQNDLEFRDAIAKAAIYAASQATGIKVMPKRNFDYEIVSKSKRYNGLDGNDFDDAIQAAIIHLSSKSAANPEQLNNADWVKTQLGTGAQNYIRNLVIRTKERAIGCGEDDINNSSDPIAAAAACGDTDDDKDHGFRNNKEKEIPETPKIKFGNIEDLEIELQNVKQQLKNTSIQGELRKRILRYGIDLENQLARAKENQASKQSMGNLMQQYNKPRTPIVPARKPVAALPDVVPQSAGYSAGYDDDDRADPEDLKKYRRRMSAEGFTFNNYLNFKEATAAIYDGTKEKDFQWEGAPKSMRKIRKQ